mmetsp:Transcript_5345/g.4927  ORF Transcript_5345/g.4927 Transcript_5345/m.4927 type:complete len:199 (+) Transcript_5345:819-1415(+)
MLDGDNFLQEIPKPSPKRAPKKDEEEFKSDKDNMFTIFHALGKFLYNKRVNSSTGEVEQMKAKQLKNPEKRPPLYFRHDEVLNQIQVDKPLFALYLHENMVNFFNSVDDIASCLEVFSYTDSITSSLTYSFNNQQYSLEMDSLATLIDSMGVTEFNVHGGELKGTHKQFYAMQKPFYFDHLRELKQNKILLRDLAKEN